MSHAKADVVEKLYMSCQLHQAADPAIVERVAALKDQGQHALERVLENTTA